MTDKRPGYPFAPHGSRVPATDQGWLSCLGRCQALQDFVMAVMQIRDNIMDLEANTVIELPDGARWLGLHDTPAQHTFIRPCYSRILEARSEYLAETRYARPEKIIACITGNSGVGMMRLCGIVLARAILEAHPVVQEVVSTADASRTFYRSRRACGCYRQSWRAGSYLNEASREGLKPYYNSDGGSQSLDPRKYRTVTWIFSSSVAGQWKLEDKRHPSLFLYMLPCSYAELERCRNGIPEFQTAEAQGLEKLMACSQDPELVKFYLALEKGLFTDIAAHLAGAVTGLQPKINIWTTDGAEGAADSMAPLRNLSTALSPMMEAVGSKAGMKMPTWMPQMPTEEDSKAAAAVSSKSHGGRIFEH